MSKSARVYVRGSFGLKGSRVRTCAEESNERPRARTPARNPAMPVSTPEQPPKVPRRPRGFENTAATVAGRRLAIGHLLDSAVTA